MRAGAGRDAVPPARVGGAVGHSASASRARTATSRAQSAARRAPSARRAATIRSRSSFRAIASSAPGRARRLHAFGGQAIPWRSSAGCSRTRVFALALDGMRTRLMANSAELIDAFCDQLWLQDGLAASSLSSYRRDLAAFAAWLGARGLLAADRGDVERWLADQFHAKAKATSSRGDSPRSGGSIGCSSSAARCATIRQRACTRRSGRADCRSSCRRRRSKRCSPRRDRNDAGIARPRDARNALRHRPARIGVGRPAHYPGVARHGRRARAGQGQQGTARAARRRSRRMAAALPGGGAAGARRRSEERVRSSSPRATRR